MTTDFEDKRKKDRASVFKGVYKSGKKWKAQIQIDGKQHYLGVFDSEAEAAERYKRFAIKHGRHLPVSLAAMHMGNRLFQSTFCHRQLVGRCISVLSGLNAQLLESLLSKANSSIVTGLKQKISHLLMRTRQLHDRMDSHSLVAPVTNATKAAAVTDGDDYNEEGNNDEESDDCDGGDPDRDSKKSDLQMDTVDLAHEDLMEVIDV